MTDARYREGNGKEYWSALIGGIEIDTAVNLKEILSAALLAIVHGTFGNKPYLPSDMVRKVSKQSPNVGKYFFECSLGLL